MNRAERRKREREYKKEYKKAEQKKETLYNWLDTLGRDKYELIIGEIKRQAIEHGNSVMETMDRCLKAVLIEELDMELDEVQAFLSKVIDYMGEDTNKIGELRKYLGDDVMTKIEELKEYMIKDIRLFIEDGKKDKDIRPILVEKYPQLSKANITNTLKKIRKEYNAKATDEVNTVLKAMNIEPATPEELEKADIIESPTKPLEEEKVSNEVTLTVDGKKLGKAQNGANNGIEIKSYKKSTTIEAKGKNYSYNIIKTEDKGGVYTDVIREDGVRFSNIAELEAYKKQAIAEALKVIQEEFEEGKAILNV